MILFMTDNSFHSYCSSLYTSQLLWKYKVNPIRKLYIAYNNAFRMLFMLPRDCSSGTGTIFQQGGQDQPFPAGGLGGAVRGRAPEASGF